jgi:hypothetical protein
VPLATRKGESMTAEKVLEKVKEYLKDNKEASSEDIKADSEHLLFWIENWEEQNVSNS